MNAAEIKEAIVKNLSSQMNEQGYFTEQTFYHPLTKTKDANLPSDRTNVPNADILNRTKEGYLSNEQILDIFGKPLDSKDYELTTKEQDLLKNDPSQFKAILHLTPAAPCRAHLLNMYLDECGDEKLGKSNDTMLQWSQCNGHFYKWTTCLAKHRKWYEARFNSLTKVVPSPVERGIQDTHPRRDPSTYRAPNFDN
ncbi:hypothetical protein FDP41_009670 [Naegleria fowleri]|uniref:Uncharacterized protein n=1 Tax=Naegleria fowleri TaxID=5763 RepID=A0A6A5BD20_NAEFO|nr:uncharacterized protein FDP41_009670 [Naegleria fowleri]KAF0971974.1 hypothetical protein FDP41_009670 [Naegleria fowleri]CAG4714934.1 unnamed protein product [Naegleria fowleri]